MARARGWLVAAGLALAVAGCGSTSSSKTSSTGTAGLHLVGGNTYTQLGQTSTPAQTTSTGATVSNIGPADPSLLARANSMCAVHNMKVIGLPAITPTTVALYNSRVAALNAQVFSQLHGVIPPAAFGGRYAIFFGDLHTLERSAKQITDAIDSHNLVEARALLGPELATATHLVTVGEQLRLPDCGRTALLISGSGRS